MVLRPFSKGVRVLQRILAPREEFYRVGWAKPYYVVTQLTRELQNEKLHSNSGAPDYDVAHLLSDLTIDQDLDLGAYALETTGLVTALGFKTARIYLKQESATRFSIRNAADNTYYNLTLRTLLFADLTCKDAVSSLCMAADLTAFLTFAAYNGATWSNVARIQSGATPTFDIIAGRLLGSLNGQTWNFTTTGLGEFGRLIIDTPTLVVNAPSYTDKVGIGTATPASLLHIYENTALVDAAAGLTIEQDGAGDALCQFLLTGGQRWVMGIDNSRDDDFRIARTADLESHSVLLLGVDGNMEVNRGGTSGGGKITSYGKVAADIISDVYVLIMDRGGGVGGVGLGGRMLFRLENSEGYRHDAAKLEFSWDDPLDTSEDANIAISTMQAGGFTSCGVFKGGGFIFPSYTDATRPAAGMAGRVIFNTNDGQLNIDDGAQWTLPDGTPT